MESSGMYSLPSKRKPKPPKKSGGGRVNTGKVSSRGGIGMDRGRTCVGKKR